MDTRGKIDEKIERAERNLNAVKSDINKRCDLTIM